MSTGSIGSFGTRAFDSATQKCNMQKELSNEPTLHCKRQNRRKPRGYTHGHAKEKTHCLKLCVRFKF
jgi:hypothetical protein